jgi:hypothetical protein
MDDHHARVAVLFAAPSFTVVPWRDPVIEANGWPADDWRTLWFFTPILGPTATLMLHRLGGFAAEGETTWRPAEFGASFGLRGIGRQSAPVRTLARLCQFGFVRVSGTSLAVRTHVGPLRRLDVDQLPAGLAATYHRWVESR